MSVVIVLAAIILFERILADDITGCVGGFCFTIPGHTASYDAANNLCQSKGSILAVYDDNTRIALNRLLDSAQINSTIYLQYKVIKGGYTWYLLNGTAFSGEILYQDPRELVYKLYGCLNNGYVFASDPKVNKSFICEFNASGCQNRPAGVSFISNSRCYVKYDIESLTWFKARERCVNEGGDLAMIQNSQSFSQSFFLNAQTNYWLGIRWMNWAWKYSYSLDGVSREMIYTYWSSNEPNTFTNECICVDPQGNPKWSWSDCDCSTQRPFICLSVNSIATSTSSSSRISFTSTAATSATTSLPQTAHSELPVIPADSQDSSINKAALTVGLVLGIGVILPLLIVIVVLSIFNCRLKRQLRDNNGRNANPNRMKTASNDLPHYQASHEVTVNPVLHYEPLKLDGLSGTQTGMGTYEQLNH